MDQVAFLLTYAACGTVLALPALWPRLRQAGQRHIGIRRIMIVLFGLAAFGTLFGAVTRGIAIVALGLFPGTDCFAGQTPYCENALAIQNELWLRQMIPPALRGACYSFREEVCLWAKEVLASPGGGSQNLWGWNGYQINLSMGVVAALTSGIWVWVFTRKRQPS